LQNFIAFTISFESVSAMIQHEHITQTESIDQSDSNGEPLFWQTFAGLLVRLTSLEIWRELAVRPVRICPDDLDLVPDNDCDDIFLLTRRCSLVRKLLNEKLPSHDTGFERDLVPKEKHDRGCGERTFFLPGRHRTRYGTQVPTDRSNGLLLLGPHPQLPLRRRTGRYQLPHVGVRRRPGGPRTPAARESAVHQRSDGRRRGELCLHARRGVVPVQNRGHEGHLSGRGAVRKLRRRVLVAAAIFWKRHH